MRATSPPDMRRRCLRTLRVRVTHWLSSRAGGNFLAMVAVARFSMHFPEGESPLALTAA